MCGIWALFGLDVDAAVHSNSVFTKIIHRGPDAWRLEADIRMAHSFLGFHRLKVVDSVYGMQPMKLHCLPDLTLMCNGEIYNCHEISKDFGFTMETRCDVEPILHLFGKGGIEMATSHLDAEFAFCLVDAAKQRVYLARDPFGVRPLFRLYSETGVLGVCSEAKGLVGISQHLNGAKFTLEPFPPGTFEEYSIDGEGRARLIRRERFYEIGSPEKPKFKPFVAYEKLTGDVHSNIRTLLSSAVKKRLMADRRIGCLLSGGLDSSLIAALLVKLAKEANLPYPIQTFSIGMGDSPDIIAAREVAKHIGSEHHEIIFTEEDVVKVLDEVICTLETFDITTIRASVGMYLISRAIKLKTDTTVILSGEGADELAQGYIYFRDAPSTTEARAESLRLLKDIYLFDGLRADRTTAAWSLELRVPFLDLQFTNYMLSLPPDMLRPKNGVEKHLLRSAFEGTGLLPDSILWRHKEAFSDGVTSIRKSLFQIIQDIVVMRDIGVDLKDAKDLFPHCTPQTREALYYRQMFEKNYPKQSSLIPYIWMPRWVNVSDPSARVISHYAAEKAK
ncbi:Asparagine synthetase [glutamine-hydrolyzing] [Frankliniella fusca]|uniref:Asparagine synthetase [glutamine-hydrolyzing] n=1 Tax=Frankliniella fusca TaxID=407009 RepID=A0AAE1GSK0_9NEOP|nr:Asparagine synthetase [glutamine-hydrolyzing] [Frankliniella fusca]